MSVEIVALDEIASIVSGFAFKSEQFNNTGDGLPLVRIRDVTAGRSSTFYPGPYREDFVVNDGDALIGMDGEFNLGVWQGGKALLNQRVCRVESSDDRLSLEYLIRFLPNALKAIEARTPFVTVKHLSVKELRAISIPLPPLKEQQRIAAILDKADALRAKRREAIAKLDQLLQSVFLDMFGDPVSNPKDWPKESLASLFEIARGGSPRPIDAYITDSPDGINWIMIGDTVEGSKYIDSTRKKIRKEGVSRSRRVHPGDFLLTNSMSFGRPYILRTSGCIHDGWLVLSPKDSRTSQDYLHSALSSPSIYTEFARRAPGATVKNLNIDLVSGVEIPVPPSGLQAKFSEAIQKIEGQAQRLKEQASRLESLFASLQHRAFTGTL
ncbi:restriction endonuclease subunit S [Luteimonas sp. A277]